MIIRCASLCFACIFAVTCPCFAATPVVTAVLNAGDFSTHLAPGLLTTVSGSGFGSGPASSVMAQVSGQPAAVLYVSDRQLTVQLPVDAATGAATFTVATSDGTSAPFSITLDTYAPAVATQGGAGLGFFTGPAGTISSTLPAQSGDSLIAYVLGLGATNPVTPTGTAPSTANATATQPTLTVGGIAATISYAGVTTGEVALYQINFTVPPGLQGNQPVVVSIGGKSSMPVTLAMFGISSVVSNASFGSAGTASPGSIASVFVNGIGTTDQTSGFPATSFQGVSVLFNGVAAPMFHLVASAGQIDVLVPYELPAAGTVNVQVKTSYATTANYSLKMADATPALYFAADPSTPGRFNVLAQFANTVWLALPDSMTAALKLPNNCAGANVNPLSLCGQPAAPGDYLIIYATGLGKATPGGDPNGTVLKTGQLPPADGSVLYQTVVTPIVTIGGVATQVTFAGIAPGFPGLYQIDVQVPPGAAGDDVAVVVGVGTSATDTRTIAVRLK